MCGNRSGCDQLIYSWSSSKGTFPSGTIGGSITWKAPDESGNITISVIVNDGQNVADGSVNITVEANPQLSVTPTSLEFGTTTNEASFDITNSGTGTIIWSVSENLSWLTLDKTSGSSTTETDKVTATVDRSGIEPGSYDGIIAITINGGNEDIVVTIEVDEFTDSRDNKTYKTVKIGDQWWMAKNLAYLPKVSPLSGESYTEPYYYVYGYSGTDVSAANASDNYETYGVLYNWPAALTVCPCGWHLPTDDEWKQLEMSIGMSQSLVNFNGWRGTNEGTKLKAINGWNMNGNGTNDYGFSALPGGSRDFNGRFYGVGVYGKWWSATEYSSNHAWNRSLTYDFPGFYRDDNYKDDGYSVRCVRD